MTIDTHNARTERAAQGGNKIRVYIGFFGEVLLVLLHEFVQKIFLPELRASPYFVMFDEIFHEHLRTTLVLLS